MEKETTHTVGALLSDFSACIATLPANGEQTAICDADEYVREAKRKAAIERYRIICPPDYRNTNWQHANLAPYSAQINAILGWKYQAKGIIAAGPTGCGKTRALWELYRRLTCEDIVDARFYHAADWFSTLQMQLVYGRDEAQGWVEAVADRRVVFIDDFGQAAINSSKTDWAAGWFFRFLDLRVGKRLPVIMSTNLHSKEFSGELRGDPMVRRLLDVCDPVKFWSA